VEAVAVTEEPPGEPVRVDGQAFSVKKIGLPSATTPSQNVRSRGPSQEPVTP